MAHATSTGYGPRSRLYYDGDPNKYQIWETRFLSFLFTQDKAFHKAILPKATGVEDDTDFDEKNKTAYAELVQVLDERSLMLIMNDAPHDGRAALQILRQHYASTEKPRVLTLYEELTTLVMSEQEDITDYIIRGERASTGLRAAGEQISDNLVIAMLLKGLPESFRPFVVVHTQLDKVKTLTEFKAQLRNYASTEALRKDNTSVLAARGATSTPPPSRGKTKHKPNHCTACGDKRHRVNMCPNKSKLTCNYCKKPFHCEKTCYIKKRDQNQQTTANAVSQADTFSFKLEVVDMAHRVESNTMTNRLVVDSGATSHILNNADRFVSYDKTFNPANHFVEVADGHMSNQIVTARGNAKYQVVDSNGLSHEIVLENALLAPSFPTNLFSVRAAVGKGANVVFSKDDNYLQAGQTKFNLSHDMNLYFLQTDVTKSYSSITKTLEQWHVDLGHMNYDDIIKLAGVTRGMNVQKTSNPGTCVICKENKMTKQPKSQDDEPILATKPLERVHSDIQGPIGPPSREGYRYVINFVDEYSSMLFTYSIRSKDEATSAFKRFLSVVAPIGQVKELHTDNGGEYLGQNFQSLLLDRGIKHTTTAPHTAYQNGKAERSWRSIMEMARCLLVEADLPKQLWPYAVKYATYLRNRAYQQRTAKTAYEIFCNHKPDMRKIYSFGAPCTYYDESQKHKLDPRGKHGIYIGVNTDSQGYYILTDSRRILTTRNIVIHKAAQPPPNHTIEPEPEPGVSLSAHKARRAERVASEQSVATVSEQSDTTQAQDQSKPDDLDASLANQAPLQASCQPEIPDKVSQVEDGNTRPQRNRKKPSYLKDYHLTASVDFAYAAVAMIPETYEQAISSPDSKHWKAAMDKEIETIKQNDTWDIKPLPDGRSETKGRWVYTIKQCKDVNQTQFKARYVAKGFTQVHGLDYFDTYSPTTRFTSIRALLQKAANDKMVIHQLDVKGAYLNAPIDTDIYLQQPPGYEQSHPSQRLTCHLKKSLYGLKQSGRNWHQTLTDFLKSEDFIPTANDPCVYKSQTGESTFILFWVDDILIASKSVETMNIIKEKLSQRFNMDDRGELNWFLGIDFKRHDGQYQMSQKRYTEEILKRFGMSDCKPVQTPADKNVNLVKSNYNTVNEFPYRQLVGSLIYLNATRPDISWIVSKLSQFLDNPSPSHVTAAKRVLRYLKGTLEYSLMFSPTDGELTGFCDADWAGDCDDRRSTTGYIFTLGTANSAPISWKSRKQSTVALSSTEAEYMSLSDATKEMIFLRSFCQSLDMKQPATNTIFCDNQSAISLSEGNPVSHARTKHIDIRHHFIREQTQISYQYINTADNPADCLTKPLASPNHRSAIDKLGISV